MPTPPDGHLAKLLGTSQAGFVCDKFIYLFIYLFIYFEVL
jgi:hypothetical protein